jgi:glucokinase
MSGNSNKRRRGSTKQFSKAEPKARPATFAGIDVGGTTTKLYLIDADDGANISTEIYQVDSLVASGPKVTAAQCAQGLESLLNRFHLSLAEVAGVGLCTPGPATQDGVIGESPNLHNPEWVNFNFRGHLSSVLNGTDVYYGNDCNFAALGEFMALQKIGITSQVFVNIAPGTGLGGGAVVHGKLLSGANGAAMEIGHLQVPGALLPFRPRSECGCGRKFCFESALSLGGLSHELQRCLSLKKWRKHPLRSRDPSDAARSLLGMASDEKDQLALSIFQNQAKVLGLLIAQVGMIVDPDRVSISGGLADSSADFRSFFKNQVVESAKAHSWKVKDGNLVIDWATMGDQAGAFGAAHYARNEYIGVHG